MLLTLGTDISRLEYHTRQSLDTVESLWKELRLPEAVITCTGSGAHLVVSLHYQNRAYDLRLPTKDSVLLQRVLNELRQRLGISFDVVLSKNCIHVEYDPKP